MVLDEIMAHAVISAGSHAVTAELTIRYLSAVDVGELVRVYASLDSQKGRLYSVSGTMTREDGSVVARSTGKFFAPSEG